MTGYCCHLLQAGDSDWRKEHHSLISKQRMTDKRFQICRLVILGGGKGAQSRGGCVRRVLLHETFIGPEDALEVYTQCCKDNPSVTAKVLKIQKIFRGFLKRRQLDSEGIMKELADARDKIKNKKVETLHRRCRMCSFCNCCLRCVFSSLFESHTRVRKH